MRLAMYNTFKLQEALKIAQGAEWAMQSANQLPGPTTSTAVEVNTVELKKKKYNRRAQKPGNQQSCIRCRGTSHNALSCLHEQSTCYNCNNLRHLACKCSKGNTAQKGKNRLQKLRTNALRKQHVKEHQAEDALQLRTMEASGTVMEPVYETLQ